MGCSSSKAVDTSLGSAARTQSGKGTQPGKGTAKQPIVPNSEKPPTRPRQRYSAATGPEPPDLAGKITNISPAPLHETALSSIYTGTYNNAKVALKVLKNPDADQTEKLASRIRQEMKFLFQPNHDNLIRLYGYDSSFKNSVVGAMVTPWFVNGHARDYIKTKRPPLTTRIELLLNVCDGIVYLHSLDIVHGDLKPENIFINDQGRALLADFGLSHDDDKSQGTVHIPTARYCAPELITAEPPVPPSTKESDVWSLGSVAAEFIFEITPYQRIDNYAQVIVAISKGMKPADRPASIETKGPNNDMWRLIETCWDSQPKRRPSAAVFTREVRRSSLGKQVLSTAPSTSKSGKVKPNTNQNVASSSKQPSPQPPKSKSEKPTPSKPAGNKSPVKQKPPAKDKPGPSKQKPSKPNPATPKKGKAPATKK